MNISSDELAALHLALKKANRWYEDGFDFTTGDSAMASLCAQRVSDLSPLKDLPIRLFFFPNNLVIDLLPLKDMPLSQLLCADNLIQDLSALKGKSLSFLDCRKNRIIDLSPLHGMPIKWLHCDGNQITTLDPLKGMPLQMLSCGGNKIRDLSPLRGLEIIRLCCVDNDIEDLSPLEGMKLEYFSFSPGKVKKGIDVIRAMSSLRGIGEFPDLDRPGNLLPVDEFWKKYDAGDFGKPC